MALLEVILDALANQFEGQVLLALYQSFDWMKCLKPFFMSLDGSQLLKVLKKLEYALPASVREKVSIPTGKPRTEELIEEARFLYKLSAVDESTVDSILFDILRAWSSRQYDASGRLDVGQAIEIVFVNDSPHKVSRPISKVLQ